MRILASDVHVSRAADVLLAGQFCLQKGQSVLITADNRSDPLLVDALAVSADRHGGRPIVMSIPQLPFQGKLADPYLAEPLLAATASADIWLDMTFPSMAGSRAFDEALKAKRARYLLLGDIGSEGFGRMYARVDFDRLFELQSAMDAFFALAEGKSCRITTPAGSNFTFRLQKAGARKERFATKPGAQTVFGSALFHPDLDSVRGVIALESIFHEYYTQLPEPLVLEVDGKIRSLKGRAEDSRITERALRRAAGGEYGHVIHLSLGLHPCAVATGRSFIEDIRVVGANAIGLGEPWWVPGGGENHPDGVITNQSMWIEDQPVVQEGRLVNPQESAALLSRLTA
jgi:leucyl aminopeptidase (aminopeptidase T)